MLIIDSSNAVIAQTDDLNYLPLAGYQVAPVPDEFSFEAAAEWAWNGTALIRDPVLVLARIKAHRLADLAALRYQHETAGITISGMTIETDRESQALITGAYCTSLLNPSVLIDWKGGNGWTQIDAATIAGIAGAVSTHVQACFSNERVLSEALDSATTLEDLSSIDITIGWP